MNIQIGSRCFCVETESELRSLCIWWSVTRSLSIA